MPRTQRRKFTKERKKEENPFSCSRHGDWPFGSYLIIYICRRGSFSSLRVNEKERRAQNFRLQAKRERTSSSNLIAPELVPEPEAPLVIDGKKERGFPFHSTNYLFEADSSQCSFYRYWKSQREWNFRLVNWNWRTTSRPSHKSRTFSLRPARIVFRRNFARLISFWSRIWIPLLVSDTPG